MTDAEIVARYEEIVFKQLTRNDLPWVSIPEALCHAAGLIGSDEVETLLGYFFDKKHRLIAVERLAQGCETGTSFSTREICRHALAKNAWQVLFVHNHPNEDATASKVDRSVFQKVQAAMAQIGVLVIGSWTIGGNYAEDVTTGIRTEIVKVNPKSVTCNKCGQTLQ